MLASLMKSARHLASPSMPSASIWATIAAFDAALAVPVRRPVGWPLASTSTPDELAVRPSAVSAAWFTRGPVTPPPVIHTGLFGIAALSSANVKIVGLSSWLRLQPPEPVQIQRPSASSSAFALYIASACAREVTRSSRTPWVQQW